MGSADARGLENDPKLISEFVSNRVHYKPIFGWRNDATATLFVELMCAARFTANYRVGAITYDVATLANLLGTENDVNAVLGLS